MPEDPRVPNDATEPGSPSRDEAPTRVSKDPSFSSPKDTDETADTLVRKAEALLDDIPGAGPDDAPGRVPGEETRKLATGGALRSATFGEQAASKTRGDRVGKFEITGRLGKGGMGEVLSAQDTELHRNVALKRVQRGTVGLSSAGLLRLEQEARTLSQLDHPNICRIYDLARVDGDTWLVLELIDGTNLRQLGEVDSKERLEIAEQIARALEAAHRAAIVHRDLKPENVMLDQQGVVKVLDFGISRPVSPEEAELDGDATPASPVSGTGSPLTAAGSIVGTPAYMSPEQLRGDSVGTATDLYAFGLVLVNLFTGAAATPPTGSRVTKPEPSTLERLPRDVRSLVTELLRDAPSARPTAQQVIQRLRRIRGTPARRLRYAIAVIALLAGAALALKYTLDVRHERDQAVQARTETEEVAEFLVSLFEQANPTEARGRTITVEDLLDEGSRRVTAEMANQPLVRAKIEHTIGDAYRMMGLLDKAELHFDSAIELLDGIDRTELTVTPLVGLGLVEIDRGDFEQALALANQAIEFTGQDGTAPNLEYEAYFLKGMSLRMLQRAEEADAALKVAERIAREAEDEETLSLGDVLSSRGLVAWGRERTDEAIQLLSEATEISERTLGADSPTLATHLSNLGLALTQAGEYDRAYQVLGQSVAIKEKVYGPTHASVAIGLDNLAGAARGLGHKEETVELVERSLSILESHHGPENVHVGVAVGNLAVMYNESDRNEEALEMAERSLRIAKAAHGEGHTSLSYQEAWRAIILEDLGRLRESMEGFLRALELMEGDPDPAVMRAAASYNGAHRTGFGAGVSIPSAELCTRATTILSRRDLSDEEMREHLPGCVDGEFIGASKEDFE